MSVPAAYFSNLNNLGAAGVGALGTYAGINRGGNQGIQSALGAASKGAAGVGSFTGDSTGALGQASNTLGGAGNALGVLNGVQQGGVTGYGGAAINAGNLAGRTGALGQSTGALNTGVGDASNALAIYQGIKQGGVGGYGGAAANTAQLAGRLLGNSALSTVGGYVAAPLAVYNAVKNYKSGATGQDALGGAEAGAAIGSVIPVVGTAVGAIVGGLVGAGASAFGPGKEDPENLSWNDYAANYAKNPQSVANQGATNDYQDLAGIFDSRGSQIPFYDQYGRMGENQFLGDFTDQINKGIADGTIKSTDSAADIESKVIDPWVTSMGQNGWQDTSTIKGAPEKAATQNLLTSLTQDYIGGNSGDWTGVAGQKVSVDPYAGATPGAFGPAAPAAASAPTAQAAPATNNPDGWYIPGTAGHAEGGIMRKKRAKGGALRQCFDDGGDVDYGDTISSQYTPETNDWSNYQPTLQDPGADYFNPDSTNSNFYDQNNYGQYVNAQNDPGGYQADPSTSASLASLLKTYAPAIPLIAALAGSGKGTSGAPAAPNGLQAGVVGPMPTPQFNRTQVANPTNRADGQPMTQQDWYTYGSRPGANFFNNNQVPLTGPAGTGVSPTPTGQATQATQASTPTPPTAQAQPVEYSTPSYALHNVMAKGGALSQASGEMEPMDGDNEFNSKHQQHVRGPGDGTSDDIPAKLSDGEYVFDANTVSMLGNGSNDAGARALDTLRQNLRKHAAKPMSKGKQFMKAKPPEKYLGKGSK